MDGMAQATAVAGVLALLAATLWVLRRRGLAVALPRRNQGRRLESLERLPLGPHHSLHLVRWGEQALLVSCGPGGCRLMATRTGHERAAAAETRP